MSLFPTFEFRIWLAEYGVEGAEKRTHIFIAFREKMPWDNYPYDEFMALFLGEDDFFHGHFAWAIAKAERQRAWKIDAVRHDFSINNGTYEGVLDCGDIIEVVVSYIAPGCIDRLVEHIKKAIRGSLMIGPSHFRETPVPCDFPEVAGYIESREDFFRLYPAFSRVTEELVTIWKDQGPLLDDFETITPSGA